MIVNTRNPALLFLIVLALAAVELIGLAWWTLTRWLK